MKKLDVLGSKVTVKIKKIEDENTVAEFCDKTNTITIQPTDENKYKSLLHELGHAYWLRSGIFQATRNEEIEEVFCETFSHLIYDNIIVLYQMFKKLEKK